MIKAPPFTGTTVREAREYVKLHAQAGLRCPCCNRINKIYKYNIVSTMVQALAWACRQSDPLVNNGWVDFPETGSRDKQRFRNHPKLQYWGLLERRKDKKKGEVSSGLWRPTVFGREFMAGRTQLAQFAYVYNNRVLSMSKERVDIEACRGHFDLSQV
jgi:hypothetical protein